MQIKVNVINEMKKLRSTAYADRLSWVDELLQNTQRANAKRVDIEVTSDSFKMVDDGRGCDSPEALFEKSTSGWGEELNSQNPFGEGFFSTIMVADKITVRSVGFEAVLDIEEMFEKETVECIDVKGSARRHGFVVELENIIDEEYRRWKVEDRVRETARYLDGMNIYLNGEKMETRGFQDVPEEAEEEFTVLVDNEYFEGWLAPTKDWAKDIELYAQKRKVRDIYKSDIQGIIHAKDGKLDLRSPDRKDYISNNKSTEFRAKLDDKIRQMWLRVVTNGSDEDLSKYDDAIDNYLEVEEYEKFLKFMTTENLDLKELLKKWNSEDKKEEERQTLGDVMENLDWEESNEELQNLEITDGDNRERPNRPSKRRKKMGKGVSELKEETMKTGYYVKKDEMKELDDKVSLAEYFDIPVIIVRNKLEERVMSKYVPHVSEMEKRNKMSAKLDNVGEKDDIEKRAKFIFSSISSMLGLDKNIFKIGDMTVSRVQVVGDKEKQEKEEKALAIEYQGKIYIDREELKTEGLELSKSKRITNRDRKFILDNLDTIAHELAHALKGTIDNTKEHEVAQRKIRNKIVTSLY
jgi:hypothetical protein